VDAWLSSPRCQASPEASEDSSGILGEGDESEQTTQVCERHKGKQLIDEEPSPKRKKSTGTRQRKEGPVTIGITAPLRRWQMIVMSSSEDDRTKARPTSKAATPPVVAPGGTETRGMRLTREVVVTVQPGA
jgi:hypothetical protein